MLDHHEIISECSTKGGGLIDVSNFNYFFRALSDFFVARACTWYSSLFSFLPVMAPTDEEWLPKGVTLPTDLTSWLGNPSYLGAPQR